MINFKLKDLKEILPAGAPPDFYLSWFWLTDGELWLKFGDETIYKYSQEALTYFDGKSSPYNEYELVRFLEDFTQLFAVINESVPPQFYRLTADLFSFNIKAKSWLGRYETEEEEYSDLYLDEYDKLISWVYERTFDSGHLIGGPHLSFFRHESKIRIVWDVEHTLENGVVLWTAQNGSYEMEFSGFIKMVRNFGSQFFQKMDTQVKLAVEKDWGQLKVDKKRLIEENEERKREFYQNLDFLENGSSKKTDWTQIELLYNRMLNEME